MRKKSQKRGRKKRKIKKKDLLLFAILWWSLTNTKKREREKVEDFKFLICSEKNVRVFCVTKKKKGKKGQERVAQFLSSFC